MHSTPSHIRFFLPLLGALLLTGTSLLAQNQLVANPEAVKLRRIWMHAEGHISFEEYGSNIWGGMDISGDDTADFAVYQQEGNTWYFYEGGNPPKTEPFWQKDAVGGSIPPYVSSYWNDGRRFIMFRDGYQVIDEGFSRLYDRIRLYELTEDGVSDTWSLEVDQGKKEPAVERFLRDIYVLDVSNDSVNDVIITLSGTRLDTTRTADKDNQVWIYFGGENFQLDEPDVVIRDTHEVGDANNWAVRFFDFDGNGQMDMLLGGTYEGVGDMIRFYWGDDNSPASWAERPPDRDVRLVHGQIGINSFFGLGIYDLDGDGAADLASQEYEDVAGVRVYLSSRKSIRERSFTLEDADVYYQGDWTMNYSLSAGSLNDSTGTYDMLPIGGLTKLNHYARYYVSGSPNGPNHDYEASYVPAEDGVLNRFIFSFGGAIGDVNNDGWPDVGYSTPNYGVATSGVALILAGGPYIPFDDPSTVVEEVPIAGESGGLFLWPNPVRDVLQIAWRGNLKEKPARFAVFDMTGKEVVSGTVDPYVGAARWDCASVASGAYILVAYAADDHVIATAEVLKQ